MIAQVLKSDRAKLSFQVSYLLHVYNKSRVPDRYIDKRTNEGRIEMHLQPLKKR